MNAITALLLRNPSWSIMLWANGTAPLNITFRAKVAGKEHRLDISIAEWDLQQEGFREAFISDQIEAAELAFKARIG